ncbi:MAG: OmpA family protein [Flavobacteriaceae bacterium]|jgi:outer membrane protein OmpA-like peptidoglycan-associated protein|nr:OmpA family protein [Flavobacteriaceae bacterium]
MNKNYYLAVLLVSSLIFTTCKKDNKQDAETPVETSDTSSGDTTKSSSDDKAKEEEKTEETINVYDTSFDVNSLPNATKDLGTFPYYTIPDWLYFYESLSENYDFYKREIYTGKGFYTVEGRVQINLYGEKKGEDWNEYKYITSFSKHFESLGAKKIFEGEIPYDVTKALEKHNDDNGYYKKFAEVGYTGKYIIYALKNKGKIVFFIIRPRSILVVESGEFEQTIAILKADQIQKDLNEKGKAVLHINFDTDKATLTSDGKTAVGEITKVLQTDKILKLAINGHTDNTGSDTHNLQLSKNRAITVLNAIVASGIDKSRLSSDGFGAKNPIADNSTEEGKAQNRRVELIKRS